MEPLKNQLPKKLVYFLPVILLVILVSLVGFANEPSQLTEFSQPIEFSHKTHIEKGEVSCEFCHIYARRSINSGAPVMASCFGCHSVVAGSDEDPQKAIKNQETATLPVRFERPGAEQLLRRQRLNSRMEL